MLLTYSNDMQKAMGIKAETTENADKSNTWYAHTLKINRRNCVVFMHTASHFCIVLWGLKAADYKKLDFKEHLGNLLRAYYADSDVISAYLYDCGDITVAKNTDRSATSQLNCMVMELRYFQDALDNSRFCRLRFDVFIGNVFSMDDDFSYQSKEWDYQKSYWDGNISREEYKTELCNLFSDYVYKYTKENTPGGKKWTLYKNAPVTDEVSMGAAKAFSEYIISNWSW